MTFFYKENLNTTIPCSILRDRGEKMMIICEINKKLFKKKKSSH